MPQFKLVALTYNGDSRVFEDRFLSVREALEASRKQYADVWGEYPFRFVVKEGSTVIVSTPLYLEFWEHFRLGYVAEQFYRAASQALVGDGITDSETFLHILAEIGPSGITKEISRSDDF